MAHNKTIIRVVIISLLLIFSSSTYLFASWYGDLIKGGHALVTGEKKELIKWNEENINKYSISEATLGCDYKSELSGRTQCKFSAEITNKTGEHIDNIVINIIFLNKETRGIVIQEKTTLYVSVVPTVTKSFVQLLDSPRLEEAYEQLGDNFTWKYEILDAVPRGMNSYWLD